MNSMLLSMMNPQVPLSQGTPVLTNPAQPNAPAPALQGATGNRRMSARMPQMPNNRIPMGSEGLMRIGGAGLGANSQGALATLGAMANQYGAIQDYNRAADMEAYQQEVLRANEEEARRQLALKMQQDAAKDKEADPEALGELRVGMAKLQQARDALSNAKNITGYSPEDLWNRIVGRVKGNKEEAIRLFLNEIRLDSILRQVSKTKGAISNAEMALFGSQAPDIHESVQELNDQLGALGLQDVDKLKEGTDALSNAFKELKLLGVAFAAPGLVNGVQMLTKLIIGIKQDQGFFGSCNKGYLGFF